MNINVLIVEDDVDLGNLLKQYLELNGFKSNRVYNGIEAREELSRQAYDIVIIDVMMPKEDGFTLAEKMVQIYPELPFLFVTARIMKEDVMKGLKLGADDYILKPFDADELVQRVKNILKRVKPLPVNQQEFIAIGIYTFNPDNLRLASPEGEKILTQKEAALLSYFCQHQNQLIKRNDILNHLWQNADFFNGRSMDVFVSRLRKHLMEDQSIQIESIRGLGFRFTNK